jgi:hypothetical protein
LEKKHGVNGAIQRGRNRQRIIHSVAANAEKLFY